MRAPADPPRLPFQAWKAHLMGPAGCTMNLRRTHLLHKAPPPPPPQGEDSPSGPCAAASSLPWPRAPEWSPVSDLECSVGK